MTVKRYYYCDLCGEQIEPTSTRPAVGIYWDCDTMRKVPPKNTEHHLCLVRPADSPDQHGADQ